MTNFIGDYSCKLDSKGRVLLPSVFIKQMKGTIQERFVMKKDLFENCLVMYPMDEWERQNELIMNKTNPYNEEHNKFLRGFYKGTAEVTLDQSNRILVPKRLLDEIKAGKEIVLAGQFSKIEMWPKDKYDEVESGDKQFASLAEKIMSGSLNEKKE